MAEKAVDERGPDALLAAAEREICRSIDGPFVLLWTDPVSGDEPCCGPYPTLAAAWATADRHPAARTRVARLLPAMTPRATTDAGR